jgi:tripartite-type tricarboxylate transporter receptor subunit TctC
MRTAFMKACFSGLLLCGGGALAQTENYPSRPVTILIPFAAGGNTEFEYRPYAIKLSELFGKPFVLDFKAGAGTLVGTTFVAKAPPDGYLFLGASSSYAALPALYLDLPFDPNKDLKGVSIMTKKASVLVIHPSLPVTSMKEFIAYARANPDKINQSTPGAGGAPHLRSLQLYSQIGISPTFIHYKGTGPLVTDLMAGRVNVAITGLPTVSSQVKSGKVRILATTGAQRMALLPDIPTVAESGVAGYEFSGWGALFAPGRTPEPIINRVSAELAKIARMPDIIQRFREEGWQMVGSTPEEAQRWVASEIEFTRDMVKKSGVKIEP